MSRGQVPAMMRTPLAERFGLATHVEPRALPVYEMRVAKDGLRMREVEPADERSTFAPEADQRVLADTTRTPLVLPSLLQDNQERLVATSAGIRVLTPRTMYETRLTDRRTWDLDAARMTMAQLAEQLSARTDRPVIDKTGLAGAYQFRVELPELASTRRILQQAGITKDVNGNPIEFTPSGLTVVKAAATLGLTIEPGRSPIDVLVVDRVERTATPN